MPIAKVHCLGSISGIEAINAHANCLADLPVKGLDGESPTWLTSRSRSLYTAV